jgi:hypothetical protein
MAEKCYTTLESEFTKIISWKNGSFAVGSANGDIRLFKALSDGHAMNVLPTFTRGKSLFSDSENLRSIDCSKDGSLLLAAYQNHLVLFPINFFGFTGFEKSFGKKTGRPKPRILEVDLKVLMKNGIQD